VQFDGIYPPDAQDVGEATPHNSNAISVPSKAYHPQGGPEPPLGENILSPSTIAS
jgi:hypothetical protein